MDNLNDHNLFLDAVDAVVLDALARIGGDPSQVPFFRRLLAVAQQATASSEVHAEAAGASPSRTS